MPQNEPQSGERWRGPDGTIFRIFLPPAPNPHGYGVFEVWMEPPSPQRLRYMGADTLMRECRFVDDAPIDVGSDHGYMALNSTRAYEEQLMGQLQAIMNRVEPLRVFRRLLEHPGLLINCASSLRNELLLLGERYNVVLEHRVGAILFEDTGIGPQVEYSRLPGYSTPTDAELSIWNANPGMFPVGPENQPTEAQPIGDRDFTIDFRYVNVPTPPDPDHANRIFQPLRQSASDPDYRIVLPTPVMQQLETGPGDRVFQVPPPGSYAARVIAEAQQEEDNLIFQAIENATRGVTTEPSQDRFYHFDHTTNQFLTICARRSEVAARFQRLFGQAPEDFFRGLGYHSAERFESMTRLIARALLLQVPGRIPSGTTYEYYQTTLQDLVQQPGASLESLVGGPTNSHDRIDESLRDLQQLTPDQVTEMLTTRRHPIPEIQAFIEEVLGDNEMRVLFQRAFGQHPIDFFAPLEIETPSLLIANVRSRMEDMRYANGAQGPVGPTGVTGPRNFNTWIDGPLTRTSLVGFQRLAAGQPVPIQPSDPGARPVYPENLGPFTAALQQTDFTRARIGEVRNWDPPKPAENPTFWERLDRDDDASG